MFNEADELLCRPLKGAAQRRSYYDQTATLLLYHNNSVALLRQDGCHSSSDFVFLKGMVRFSSYIIILQF